MELLLVSTLVLLQVHFDDNEPSCFDEARDMKEWDCAMNEEMQALIKNETWDLVPKPKG